MSDYILPAVLFLAVNLAAYLIGRRDGRQVTEPTDRAFCDRTMQQERFNRSMFSQRMFSAGVRAERARH